MDEEASSDMQKCPTEGQMETDEGPLINENSNGLSHLLTEGEFNSVDAAVDESSTSNQGFLNAVELSTGSVGDYLENNAARYEGGNFDVGDNAVTFPSDSPNNDLNERDSLFSDTAFKPPDIDGDIVNKHNIDTDFDISESDASCPVPTEDTNPKTETEDENTTDLTINDATVTSENKSPSPDVEMIISDEAKAEEPAEINTEVNKPKTDEESETSQLAETVAPVIEIIDDSSTNQNDISMAKETPAVEEVATKNEDSDKNVEATETPAATEAPVQAGEAINKNLKVGGAEETEVVSEDELPELQQASVQDAENVSDDELPAPRLADLPADTEVVSEDELPAAKKEGAEARKRKPDRPASPAAHDAKKHALAKNGESKPVPAEKSSSTEEKPKKKLPELDKYWKVVDDDPSDFTGWTYLLQYVDQESDAEAARAAYDAFLAHYPYCYGYWRKYADYEKRKGSKKKCLEVLEKGLRAIPLSVDLWIHFLNHIRATRADDHVYIRSQYERAVEACGLEFRSDRLWESYLKWEAEHGSALHVTRIYDRLLATPTLGYTSHFDNFQEHVMSEPVGGVVSSEELVRLRREVREAAPAAPPADLPPGEDEPADHIASEEEGAAIKERIIAARRKLHKVTGEHVAARWTYEEGIKRPYFHVKPLERCQLKNWKSYLEWEKQHGTLQRALVLHERCLIACALYDDFWMRLLKYLDEQTPEHPELVDKQRDVFERACTVHHPDKPELHLAWAHFEEIHGHTDRARDILDRIEKACPDLVQIQYRRVNLERRAGSLEACAALYARYIGGAASRAVASALSVKFARFLALVRGDSPGARAALDRAIDRDPANARLHLQRLDLALHTPGTTYEELDELSQSYEKQEGAEAEVCASLAAQRAQLAEERGSAQHAAAAHRHARALHAAARKRARAHKHDAASHTAPPDTKKKETAASSGNSTSCAPPPSAAPGGAGGGASYYGAGAAGAGAHYEPGYGAPYQPPPWGYQAPPPPYHHPHTHAPWTHYTNYY